MSAVPDIAMWGMSAPARNLERGAKNLGAHKLCHGDDGVLR
jgi:hypothetical protein